jgi:N-methylhydantoinase B/oxoprolinase/acetone carboxylase alpha subunit
MLSMMTQMIERVKALMEHAFEDITQVKRGNEEHELRGADVRDEEIEDEKYQETIEGLRAIQRNIMKAWQGRESVIEGLTNRWRKPKDRPGDSDGVIQAKEIGRRHLKKQVEDVEERWNQWDNNSNNQEEERGIATTQEFEKIRNTIEQDTRSW